MSTNFYKENTKFSQTLRKQNTISKQDMQSDLTHYAHEKRLSLFSSVSIFLSLEMFKEKLRSMATKKQ